jgi:hypothetical protein
MSSNPTGHYSPLYRRPTTSYHTQVNRWTVDNSESRFHSLVSQVCSEIFCCVHMQ